MNEERKVFVKDKNEDMSDNETSIDQQLLDGLNKEFEYPYAKWILSEIKDQYAAENERENKIMNKASGFISLVIAIITLYIPLIPFSSMKSFFSGGSCSVASMAVVFIFLIILALGGGCLIIALWLLVSAYGVKGYNRVNVDDLLKIANYTGKCDMVKQSQIAESIVAHYHRILRGTIDEEGNIKINSNSADKIENGIKWIAVGFALISIATITLRIFVVV